MHVGIIGGGIAGLVAAYDLSEAGSQVTLFERGERLGGLAGSFALNDGNEIEKYYHFLCKGDEGYFGMLRRLGLENRLHWVTTDMGLFYNGDLYTLGDPLSLLTFPRLNAADKWRFGLATLRAKRRGPDDWKDIEDMPAHEWLVREYGSHTYEVLYRSLLESKFRDYAPRISAAWMWARFYRLGNSRTKTQKECVGYLDGGSQAYIDAIEAALRARGVQIQTGAPVERVVVENGRAAGVQVGGALAPCDTVISTVPIPHTRALFADLHGPYFENLCRLPYIGVMVMLLRLKRKFSRYYWMNVNDPAMDISGVIEYTNLNPYPHLQGDAILYIPQYLPHTHELFARPDSELFDTYCGYLRRINPQFDPSWVKEWRVHRDRFAQPICETGFSRHMPAIQTPIPNLLLTDSYQLHPHDRAISFSTDLGQKAAQIALAGTC